MKVTVVVGARPNFMKAAPVISALKRRDGIDVEVVHTGQHYDERMSDAFFRDLGIPEPTANLAVGSQSHARQTAEVLTRFEEFLRNTRSDLAVVAGDVNSTIAAALAAVKLLVPVAHIEAGLRSFDRTMPEEINRILTDSISALLFVTEPSGLRHLQREGIPAERVHYVGNSMIDTLLRMKDRALGMPLPPGIQAPFGVMTLHRPSNVDSPAVLAGILDALAGLCRDLPLLWPIHPRSEKNLEEFGLIGRARGIPRLHLLPPCGYLEFLAMMARARLILTDSGGIQEEALVLRVPVITLRDNTERPITVECGGNLLCGSEPSRIRAAARTMMDLDPAEFRIPEGWDGRAGERIADVIARFLKDPWL